MGNTRVIFEKLNDTTYTAQENHYGAWGEVLQGLGTSGDWNFLYQGQKYIDAFGYNSYDFHARGFDSNLGRFDGSDPVDNYGISNYAGMANNPLSYIDPDGRNPIIIGFMIGMFTSAVSNMIKGTMPNSIGQFLAPGIVGAVGGAFGAFAPSGLLKGVAYGAGTGAITGGLGAALSGGNIGRGALFGGITGGILGGINGALLENSNIYQTGDIKAEPNFYADASQRPPSILDEIGENIYGKDAVLFNKITPVYAPNDPKLGLSDQASQMGIFGIKGNVRVFGSNKLGHEASITVRGTTNIGDAEFWSRATLDVSGKEGVWTQLKPLKNGYWSIPNDYYKTIGSATFKLPRFGSPRIILQAGFIISDRTGTLIPTPRYIETVINIPLIKKGGFFLIPKK